MLSVVNNEFVVFWSHKKWMFSVCPPNGREKKNVTLTCISFHGGDFFYEINVSKNRNGPHTDSQRVACCSDLL